MEATLSDRGRVGVELDIQTSSYECIERAREMSKLADGMGDGKLRLLIQTMHSAAQDVNDYVSGEES